MKISVITPSIRPEGLKVVQDSLQHQTFQDFEWLVEIGFKDRMTLNKDMNKMLKRAKGELIVSVQDYIEVLPVGLEIFYEAYMEEENPKTLFTAPLGKTLDWKTIKWDWRHEGDRRPISPENWELDWAAAPLIAFYDVGGFDEDFDRGWSWDNVNLAMRAAKAGYKFEVLTENKAVGLDHDKVTEHPFRNKLENNDTLVAIKKDAIDSGEFKLDYLHPD